VFKAWLLPAEQWAAEATARAAVGVTAAVVPIAAEADRGAVNRALAAAQAAGLEPYLWVEVARDEAAARAHPEWLSEPQHTEWLELFPEQDWTGRHAVVYPWICVNNRAVFEYARDRVCRLVNAIDAPLAGVFVSDIQGGPVGCGCGNDLCRSWDNSPGEKIAPSPYERPETFFSVVFLNELRRRLPGMTLVPIICEECEAGITMDGIDSPDELLGKCHGVPCRPCSTDYYPRLIDSLVDEPRVGLLSFYKLWRRNVPLWGPEAGWVGAVLRRYRERDPAQRLISVLQGWDVSEAELSAQIAQSRAGGSAGYLVAGMAMDQSFWPVERADDGQS
jgi:hypothetical protein